MNFPDLSKEKEVVIDTETTGTDIHRDRIVAYALCARGVQEFYPIRMDGGNKPVAQVNRFIKDVMSSGTRIVGHNLKFDLHMMAKEGIFTDYPVSCTMVNQALINENEKTYDLDSVSTREKLKNAKDPQEFYRYLHSKFDGKEGRAQMANYHMLSGNDKYARKYALSDVRATWELHAKQKKKIARDGLSQVAEVESEVLLALFYMERTGVKIDERRLEELEEWLQVEIEKAIGSLPSGFNVNGRKCMKEYLESIGQTGWGYTEPSDTFPDGQPKFDEIWLSTFPEGRKIIHVRKMKNLLNSFIVPLRDKYLYRGRVHTNFNQLKRGDFGVVSGRLSSNSPNMQQVPKHNAALGRKFRAIFIPEDGCRWHSHDYVQQEFVVFAAYTKNKKLLDGYKSTPVVDIHSNVAKMLNVERDYAKRLNLGMVYGMGAKKLSESIGCDLLSARKFLERYNRMIPEAKEFRRAREFDAMMNGYVTTVLGRRRRFPVKDFCHKAANQLIQGTSADLTKLALVKVHKYLNSVGAGCHVMLHIHDELCCNVPLEYEDVNSDVKNIMTDFDFPLDLPLSVESTSGWNWGEASYS